MDVEDGKDERMLSVLFRCYDLKSGVVTKLKIASLGSGLVVELSRQREQRQEAVVGR